MTIKDFFHVDSYLLAFKFHFFFLYAGYSGVMPFMPVIAKQLGINATAFGIGFSMIPVFIFLSNPLIGFLVDYFHNIKKFLSFLLIASVAAYFSVLGIPKINYDDDSVYVRLSLSKDSETYLNISEPLERPCLEELLSEKIQCKLKLSDQFLLPNRTENTSTTSLIALNFSPKKINQTHIFETVGHRLWLCLNSENITEFNIKSDLYPVELLQCSPNITECSLKDKTSLVFSSYQFWAFTATAVVASITTTSAMTLSSVGCCEKLGPNIENYGRQRLFGTISWGIVCTLAGILNDIEKAAGKPFLSGFYLMAIFIAIDIVILCIMDIPKANISSNIWKDLGKIFSSKEILIFALGVVFVGVFNSVIAVYEFWFLEDLGANRKLLGLTVAVQCLVGEVPFLFFSGWFVNKLGHYLCLAAVFVAFTVRLISYSVIKNPWLALPVDSLHGVTFGLYHGAMTSFAKSKAPKGMEATLLGIYGGLYDGLGCGLGSFLGGIGMDNLGSRSMFFTTAMVSLGCILVFLVATYGFRNRQERKT